MEHDFWRNKWQSNEIGFHLPEANPLIVRHFGALRLPPGSRVFLPLCGKTLDIGWLLANGYRVAGAELVESAVEQLFAQLGVEPAITGAGPLRRYSAASIDIFVGDIFSLAPEVLGAVDAVYDRAALVALPADTRERYTAHLQQLTGGAPQLLVTYVYDQSQAAGPPFSVGNDEVAAHYREHYELVPLESLEVPGGVKGLCPAVENVWLLERRH